MMLMRRGMQAPLQIAGPPITNIRNTASPHWPLAEAGKPMPGTSHQLLGICAGAESRNGKKDVVWFALDPARALFAFAGLWTLWTGTRGTKDRPVEGNQMLYGFPTAEPNGIVGPILPKRCR
jgi:hypothetical protein